MKKLSKKEEAAQIRKFSAAMAVFLAILATISLLRGHGTYVGLYIAAAAFLVLGLPFPIAMKPVYWAWMKFAGALGWFNTRLLLGLVFYLMFTPIALCLRLLGKDMLDLKLEPDRASYWHIRDRKPPEPDSYERQF